MASVGPHYLGNDQGSGVEHGRRVKSLTTGIYCSKSLRSALRKQAFIPLVLILSSWSVLLLLFWYQRSIVAGDTRKRVHRQAQCHMQVVMWTKFVSLRLPHYYLVLTSFSERLNRCSPNHLKVVSGSVWAATRELASRRISNLVCKTGFCPSSYQLPLLENGEDG